MTRNTKDEAFLGRLRQICPFSWRDCGVCLGILGAAALLCALLRMIDSSDVFVALIFELRGRARLALHRTGICSDCWPR